MKRKVLLIEPNYKNKYPPMGLMKLATYFRESGDEVRFFKGELKDLVIEDDIDKLLQRLQRWNASIKWKRYKYAFTSYFKLGKLAILEDNAEVVADVTSFEMIKSARKDYLNKDYFMYPEYDFVGITTLFTFYYDVTIETINFAKQLCKSSRNVMVGGIMASILPDKIERDTGIAPFVGQLDRAGIIDKGDKRIIDKLPLDYSILEEIEYKYPASDAYFSYMTRGCVNHCAFCAVPTLEPQYKDFISIKKQIEITNEKFGEKRMLLLLDNNVLASPKFDKIIDEIKKCGFGVDAKAPLVNQYDIAIRNLKSGYNDRAYIKKTIELYRHLLEKAPDDEKGNLYTLLEERDLLDASTADKERIIELDEVVAPIYKKIHAKERPRARYVDFNQGIDARLVTDQNMKKLAEISIRPLRIAFDHWEMKETYENAVRCAVKNGITHLSNYMLYNFKDKPEHLYSRMKLNVKLCEELDADIYSFPMKYHPIDDENYFMNRDYIGKYWNRKFIRAVQAVLNSTKGCIGRGESFFYEAFGKSIDRFYTILWMPEVFIIYRMKFKDNLAEEWENDFNSLTVHDKHIVKTIVSENKFKNLDLNNYPKQIQDVLRYYTITRDDAIKM